MEYGRKDPPRVYVIAGPNGAGKTTFAREFLPKFVDCDEFVNADLIAAGLSPFAPEKQSRRASRLVLERIQKLAAGNQTFAIETTLAGLSYLRLLAEMRIQGYQVHALFLFLPSVAMATARVEERVRNGGHNVPAEDIRRRFGRGIRNFFGVYARAFDTWTVFDNSSPDPRLVAIYDGVTTTVLDPIIFDMMIRETQEP